MKQKQFISFLLFQLFFLYFADLYLKIAVGFKEEKISN